MDSVSEVAKEELSNFLGDQLLPFLSDEDAPTDNIYIDAAGPTHLTEKELDSLFSNAFEEFYGVSSQLGEISDACSDKNVQTIEPTSAVSNASNPSKAIRKFAQPVSSEDIAKTMQSAIPKKHRKIPNIATLCGKIGFCTTQNQQEK